MSSKIPGCFKYGCIGCMSIFALFFGLIFLLSAIEFSSSSESDPVMENAERVLPEPPPMPSGDFTADAPETIQLDGESSGPALPAAPPKVKGGTLRINASMVEFTLRPGPADEPVRITGEFDAAAFELREEYTEDENGEWVYEVSFGPKGGFFGAMLSRPSNNSGNNLEIIVPRGHPLTLTGEMGMGESRFDLSGLWVQDVDMEFGAGDHFIELREPAPFQMSSFKVNSSMGEMEIRGLGDASPEYVKVKHGMGALFLDLQGAWRQDAEVDVDFQMGECRVWVPENARVGLEGRRVSFGEANSRLPDYSDLPEDAPRLGLQVTGSMGELRVDY